MTNPYKSSHASENDVQVRLPIGLLLFGFGIAIAVFSCTGGLLLMAVTFSGQGFQVWASNALSYFGSTTVELAIVASVGSAIPALALMAFNASGALTGRVAGSVYASFSGVIFAALFCLNFGNPRSGYSFILFVAAAAASIAIGYWVSRARQLQAVQRS